MPKYGKKLSEIIKKGMMTILPEKVEKSPTVQRKTLAVVNEIRDIIEEITNPEPSPEGKSEIPKTRKERADYYRKLRSLTQSVKKIGKANRAISTVLHSKSRIVQGSLTTRLLLTVSYAGGVLPKTDSTENSENNKKGSEKKKLIILSRDSMLQGKNLKRIKDVWDRTD